MIDEKHGDCTLPLWLGQAKEDTPLFDQAFNKNSNPVLRLLTFPLLQAPTIAQTLTFLVVKHSNVNVKA